MVEEFKVSIKELLTKGLRSVKADDRMKRQKMLENLFEAMLPEKQSDDKVPVEIPREVTLAWLAQQT
jgi:hypothetical protein